MSSPSQQPERDSSRPFIGVRMKCCNVYVRVYANAAQDAFVGWCPRCCAPVRVPIVDEGGSTDRFFTAR